LIPINRSIFNATTGMGIQRFASRTTRRVERSGETVLRPTGAHSPFVHRVLGHLERRGFHAAPRLLGIGPDQREMLTYLPGHVPEELGLFSSAQAEAAAQILRALHDATIDFEDRGRDEVVCHGDPSPCNYVFRDGLPYALIDFDAAHVGYRHEDVGYAAWLWLDIGNDDLDAYEQGRRIGEFLLAYGGLPNIDGLEAVIAAQQELSTRGGAPIETREWAADCLNWTRRHRQAVAAALTSNRQAPL
jgi:Ser/Thr protein kinase RdoA (MazF antagonist)